jgi:hypothetical protein
VQEKHGFSIGIAVHLGGESSAVSRMHHAFQDRPSPLPAADTARGQLQHDVGWPATEERKVRF